MQNKEYTFETIDGSIRNNITGCLIQEPAVLMMNDIGSPIKLGEYSMCKNYFDSKIVRMPEEDRSNYELIKFNVANEEFGFTPEGYNLNADEVCTILNYLQHFTIGAEGWAKLKAMNLEELKAKLAQIKTWLSY